MKLLALFLCILIFIPLEYIFGDIKGFKWTMTPYYWVLSICITCCMSWLILGIFSNFSEKVFLLCKESYQKYSSYIYCMGPLLVFVLLFCIAQSCFSQTPLLIDSIVQLFQGEIFAQGRLKAIRPPLLEFFVTQHMLFDDTGWFGQYPPGLSILQVPFIIIGVPWLTNILISTLIYVILTRFAKSALNNESGVLTAILLLFCPFFLFMGASHMNHPATLLCISICIYSFHTYEKTAKNRFIFIFGLSAGYCFLIRPLDIIIVLCALTIPMIRICIKNYISAFSFFIGFAPCIVISLLYNHFTTGDMLTPGYIKLWGAGHGLGFHTSPWGNEHTPLTGLRNELVDLQLLQEMLFDWPVPSLSFLSLYGFFYYYKDKHKSPWILRLISIGLLYPCMYFFYWHRDAFLGPRFMFGSLIAWIPLTAYSIHQIISHTSSIHIRIAGILNPIRISVYTTTIIFFCFLYTMTITFPERWEIYKSSFQSVKINLREKAQKEHITEGLIFIKSSWGVRIMSLMRGLGLSASETQIAYTNIDHCSLFILIKEVKEKGHTVDFLRTRIQELLERKEKILSYNINFDPSLKLNLSKQIPHVCVRELQYDVKNGAQHYTLYEPHVRLNSPLLNGPYIVAKDLREDNVKLMAQYPHKTAYLFDGNGFSIIK